MEIISAHHSKFCGRERPETHSGSFHQVTLNIIFSIAGAAHVERRLGITETFVAAPSTEQLFKLTKAEITFPPRISRDDLDQHQLVARQKKSLWHFAKSQSPPLWPCSV